MKEKKLMEFKEILTTGSGAPVTRQSELGLTVQ